MFDANRNLTHELTRAIGIAIVNGEFTEPHKFISVRDISIKHKISTNIVRGSIKILYAKGLLSICQGTGLRATPPEQWNLFDTDVLHWALNSKTSFALFQELSKFRLAIEPEAARLAAQNCNNATKINCIRDALHQLKTSTTGSNSLRDAENDFHNAILEASNNPYFIQMKKITTASIYLRHSLQNQSKINIESNAQEYENLLSAIKAGDANGAFSAAHRISNKVASLSQQLISSNIKSKYLIAN